MTGGSYDISIWWRNTMISMSLSVSVRREDRSRPRIRHRPRQQRVKATPDHGRWWRTLPAQRSNRGFGTLQLVIECVVGTAADARERPVPSHELAMPMQQRRGCDEE